MKPWFRFENATSDPAIVDIHIIDFIGGWMDDAINRYYNESIGVTARAFVDELAKLPTTVSTLRVHINSPGGDVQGGINIANALREQQTSKGRVVETYVDGLAASIASVIAMAGSKVVMADNALMMIHDPWSIEIGNAAEMRKTADVLDTMRDQIIATYQWHSKQSSEDLAAMMAAESWLSAEEALAAGLATEVTKGLKAAASLTRAAVKSLKVPETYRARVDALVRPEPQADPVPTPASAAAVLKVCQDAGCLDLAAALLTENATIEQVQARVDATKSERQAATQRATDITALCETAKLPKLAKGYIDGGMPLAQVREQLTIVTAEIDRVEIDANLPADGGRQKPKFPTAAEIYAGRNSQPSA